MADISISGKNEQECVENSSVPGSNGVFSRYCFNLSAEPDPQWHRDFDQAISGNSVLTNMKAHVNIGNTSLTIHVPKGSNPQSAVDEVKKAIETANHSTSDFQQRVTNIKI